MTLTVCTYSREQGLQVHTSLPAFEDLSPDTVTWVDLETTDPSALTDIAHHFNLHELSIEDCFDEEHAPKLESFGRYLFMVFQSLYAPPLTEEFAEDADDEDDSALQDEEEEFTRALNLFFSERFVISHRQKPLPWVDALVRQLQQHPEQLLGSGTYILAHRIIDVLIDRFVRGLDYLDWLIDEQEELVINQPDDFQLSVLIELKRNLAVLRQIMRDHRAVLTRLAHDTTLIDDPKLIRYFRDIEDHCKDAIRTLNRQIDTIGGIRDVYLALANVRLGDIMRILAVITTIAVPLNIVVGIYGMNFDAIPLLHNPLGFWFIMGLMLCVVVLLLLFFRRKHWL